MTRILVIEDESHILENIVELLQLADYEAQGISDPRKCVEIATQFLPDLVLCDVMMPHLDGFDVLELLRKQNETSTVPFIFLTAVSNRSAMRRGMEMGADDYVVKPFTEDELLNAISARLEKQNLVEQQYESKLKQLTSQITHALPHEFRTPLTGLLGYAELLKTDYEFLDPRKVVELADQIMDSAERLQILIEKYLLYAQLEILGHNRARVEHLRKSRFDSPGMLAEETTKDEANRFNRVDDVEAHVEDVEVCISYEYLYKAVREIADNALKFSGPGTKIIVDAKPISKSEYLISITDHGRGLSAEQISQIGAYMQFDRLIYEQQGLGLGLATASRITQLHGGKLTVESVEGEQTTVHIKLPRA